MTATTNDQGARWELYRLLGDPIRLRLLALAGDDVVMRGGNRGAGEQQDHGSEQRDLQRVEGLDSLRRPVAAGQFGALELGDLAGAYGAARQAQLLLSPS